jgi:hypothetical protein
MHRTRCSSTTSMCGVESISARGIEPASPERYGDGARKVIYPDPDDNEIGFGATLERATRPGRDMAVKRCAMRSAGRCGRCPNWQG